MREEGSPAGPQPRRLACAAGALGAALALVALSGCWGQPPGPEAVTAGSRSMGAMAQQVLDGTSAEDALAAQGYELAGADGVPAWFADEVLPAERCEGCYATEGWRVVGLFLEGPADEAFDGLLAELSERGWVAYDSGVENAATLTKEEGEARWMMMQCAAVGDSTSVVLQLSR